MPFKLFDVGKIPVTLDKMEHSTERRKDGDTRVVLLTMRVQPFTAQLASAFHTEVKKTLFKQSNAEPQDHIARVNFALGVPRQHIDCYASSDTKEPTRRLDFCKVTGVYARTEKGTTGYALVWKATFGPASDKELAFSEAWLNTMKFLSFEESEPNADFDVPDTTDEGNEDPENEQLGLPAHEFETAPGGRPIDEAKAKEPARLARPRHGDKTARQRAKQRGGRRR